MNNERVGVLLYVFNLIKKMGHHFLMAYIRLLLKRFVQSHFALARYIGYTRIMFVRVTEHVVL